MEVPFFNHTKGCSIRRLQTIHTSEHSQQKVRFFFQCHGCHDRHCGFAHSTYKTGVGRAPAFNSGTHWGRAQGFNLQRRALTRPLHFDVPIISRFGANGSAPCIVCLWPSLSIILNHDCGGVMQLAKKRGATCRRNSSLTGISGRTSSKKLPGRVFISTDKSAVDIGELKSLLALTGHHCDLLAASRNNIDGGSVSGHRGAEISEAKLQRAVENSTVVVSLYMHGNIQELDSLHHDGHDSENPASEHSSAPPLPEVGVRAEPNQQSGSTPGWWKFPNQRSRLVAFGRAFTDTTLTASIHDIVVAPSLQGMGLGSKVLYRIIRELRKLGIQDISALSTPQSRGFLGACKFGPDMMGTTTMLYTRGLAPASARGVVLLWDSNTWQKEDCKTKTNDGARDCTPRLLEPPPLVLPLALNRPLFAPFEPKPPRPRNRRTAIWQREKQKRSQIQS